MTPPRGREDRASPTWGVVVGRSSADRARGRPAALALGLDEAVEPGDVVLGGLGAVLDQRAGVDVQPARPAARARSTASRRVSWARRRSSRARRAWGARCRAKARRRPKLRASSVPAGSLAVEELLEQQPAPASVIRYTLRDRLVPRPARPGGPAAGPLAAQRAGGGDRRPAGCRADSVTVTAPARSRRERAG